MGVFGSRRLTWGGLVAGLIGGVVGLVAAVIVSTNFAITVGVPGGYEASIAEVLQYNAVAGIVDALILIGGPVVGVWIGLLIHRDAMR